MLTWLSHRTPTHAADGTLAHDLDISHVLARAGVPGFRHALPLLTAEFERARRYQHALSIVLFGAHDFPDGPGADGRRPAAAAKRTPSGLFPALLASILRESTRGTDIVTYAASLGRCIIAMPETDRPQAEMAVRRLRELAMQRLLSPVSASVAVFPSDGLVLEDLIRRAAEAPAAAPGEALRSA